MANSADPDLQKQTDLDLHCFERQGISGFSRIRVLFLYPCMDLLYIWHDYRYWSKILFGSIPTPAYELEFKVTDFEIYVKVLRQSFKIS